MPIPNAKYRVKTTKSGKEVRLAFQNGQVVEAKNLKTGATHTPEEFQQDRVKGTKDFKSLMSTLKKRK